jgi:hypothetical protein
MENREDNIKTIACLEEEKTLLMKAIKNLNIKKREIRKLEEDSEKELARIEESIAKYMLENNKYIVIENIKSIQGFDILNNSELIEITKIMDAKTIPEFSSIVTNIIEIKQKYNDWTLTNVSRVFNGKLEKTYCYTYTTASGDIFTKKIKFKNSFNK